MKQAYNNLQLLDNEFIAEQAVRKDPYSLFLLPLNLKLNKKIVRIAVQQDGLVLKFAKNFSNDIEVVLDAVENNPEAITFASNEMQLNRLVALKAIKNSGFYLNYLNRSFVNDEDIVFKAVSSYGDSLKYASPILKINKKIVLAAVGNCGTALKYAAPSLKEDKEVVRVAINNDFAAIKYVGRNLKKNIDFIIEMAKINPLIVVMLDNKLNSACQNIIKYHSESECMKIRYDNSFSTSFAKILEQNIKSNDKHELISNKYKICSFSFE